MNQARSFGFQVLIIPLKADYNFQSRLANRCLDRCHYHFRNGHQESFWLLITLHFLDLMPIDKGTPIHYSIQIPRKPSKVKLG